MVREPAMIVAAFLLLFGVIIIYVRLDFSLSEVGTLLFTKAKTFLIFNQIFPVFTHSGQNG